MKLLLAMLLSVNLFAALTEQDKSFITPKNLLSNPGAEMGKSKWTASGGTFQTNATAANVGSGVAAFDWDSSSASQNLTSAAVSIPAGAYGRNGVASCNIKCASGTCTHTINAYDGTNILSSNTITSSSTYTRTSINFVFPSSGNIQLRLSSVAANEPQIFVDDCYLGLAEGINLQNVSQAQLYGVVKITGCADGWTVSSSTFESFGTQTGCSYSVSGNASAPSTNIPGIKFASLPPGEYLLQYEGNINNLNNGFNVQLQFWDGTNTAREQSNLYNGTTVNSVPTISQSIRYTTAQSNITLSLRGKGDSSTGIKVWGTDALPGVIKVYRFPIESDLAYRPDQIAWRVDANITGANVALGTSTTSSFAEVTNGSLSLTQNSGSIAAQIACASGTASSGTTCSAANESIGIAFSVPTAGSVYACLTFTHSYSTGNPGSLGEVFKIVETTNTSSTIVTSGNERVSTGDQNGGISHDVRLPVKICSTFNFSSSGLKTLRLTHQLSASGTINANDILADNATERSVHWEIFPVTQNTPAPLLVGSVTSNSSGLERVERATIGASGNTPCSSSPCTISRQSGSWLTSVTRSGTGLYTINFSNGIFSDAPSCAFQQYSFSGGCKILTAESVSSVGIECVNISNASQDASFRVICMGPR
jgi:hypothetical protein